MWVARKGDMISASSTKRVATSAVLRSLKFSITSDDNTGDLSPKAWRTLHVYIPLVKMGFDALHASNRDIAETVARLTSHGAGDSVRTLQRANKELAGQFISRVGVSNGAYIEFNNEAFAFWTKKTNAKVSPMPPPKPAPISEPTSFEIERETVLENAPDNKKNQQSHNVSPCKPVCDNVVSRETLCDENSPCKPVCDNVVSRETLCDEILPMTGCHTNERIPLSNNKNKKQRAGARANNKNRRSNPVFFTIDRYVVPKLKNLIHSEKRAIRARAKCEISALEAGIEILNPSGIDWAYWQKRWEEFSNDVKESTARRELIPLLLPSTVKNSPIVTDVEPTNVEPTNVEPTNPVPAYEIRRFREFLEGKNEKKEPAKPAPEPQPVNLDSKTLAFLTAAKIKCREVNSLELQTSDRAPFFIR
jgi:hypothetical protein